MCKFQIVFTERIRKIMQHFIQVFFTPKDWLAVHMQMLVVLVLLNKDVHEHSQQNLMILLICSKAHYVNVVCTFTDNLTSSNRYGWVHKSGTRFISSSSLWTSNLHCSV